MDLVYLYRHSTSHELRTSLRTVAANLPHDNLIFVGDPPPSWVKGAEWLRGNTMPSSPQNVFNNVRIAANDKYISDHFYVMNDDFYVLKPVEEVGMYWRSTLASHIKTIKPGNAVWLESLQITYDWLKGMGYARPRSYELHRPFPVKKEWMAGVLDLAADIRPDLPPQWRTIYGVITKAGGAKDSDLKFASNKIVDLDEYTFASSDERVFDWNQSCLDLRKRYSRMCRYESHF